MNPIELKLIVNGRIEELTIPPNRTLLEMLRSCPVDLTELDLTRSKEYARDIEL